MDGLELRVASIQAIADKERELKNTYIADRKKANEILCAYQRLLSREHGLESPANCADSATAVELVSALIADVNTIAYQYKEKLTRGDKSKGCPVSSFGDTAQPIKPKIIRNAKTINSTYSDLFFILDRFTFHQFVLRVFLGFGHCSDID